MMKVEHKKKDSGSTIAVVVVVVILLAAGFFAFGGKQSSSEVTFDTDALAQCIIESGATFYGTEWCPHCKDQKALLGDTYNQYKAQFYVDCDREQDKCLAAGIQGYPTWVIGDERLTGTQPIERIAQATNCNIEI